MKSLLLGLGLLVTFTTYAATTSCTRNNFCLGDKVVSQNNYVGIVKGILANDAVSIQLDGASTLTSSSTFLLSKTSGCIRDGFCVGQEAVTKSGLKGKVVALNRFSYKVTLELNNSLKQFEVKDLLLPNTNLKEVATSPKKASKKLF
jgi:preprotein translocase subunit YajC